MTAVTLTPGATTLVDWRAVYFGADAALDPASAGPIERSAAAGSRMRARV